MNRQRLFRGLRIAWSAAFGILCLLLVMVWVRSYSIRDFVVGRDPDWEVSIVSLEGRITLIVMRFPQGSTLYYPGWELNSFPIKGPSSEEIDLTRLQEGSSAPSFFFVKRVNELGANLPHWFLVLLSAISTTIAAWPWIREFRRFSLRTLFIVTTLVAVVLGLIVCAAR